MIFKGYDIYEIDDNTILIFFNTIIKIVDTQTKESIITFSFKNATYAQITRKNIIVNNMKGKFIIIDRSNYNNSKIIDLKFNNYTDYQFLVDDKFEYIISSYYNTNENKIIIIDIKLGLIIKSINLESKYVNKIFYKNNNYYFDIVKPGSYKKSPAHQIAKWQSPFDISSFEYIIDSKEWIDIDFNGNFVVLTINNKHHKNKYSVEIKSIDLVFNKELKYFISKDNNVPDKIHCSNNNDFIILTAQSQIQVLNKKLDIIYEQYIPYLLNAKFSPNGKRILISTMEKVIIMDMKDLLS